MIARKLERSYVRDVPGGVVHLIGKDDATPAHSTYPTGYDPACSWCWLNAGHSEAAHAEGVAQ